MTIFCNKHKGYRWVWNRRNDKKDTETIEEMPAIHGSAFGYPVTARMLHGLSPTT